jgi:hypothetical protein
MNLQKLYIIVAFVVTEILSLTSCIPPFSCEQWIKENIEPKEYKGIVKAKIEVMPGSGKVILSSNDTIEVCTQGLSKFWNKVLVSDSVYKKKGERVITVYSKGLTQTYDFPCCDY